TARRARQLFEQRPLLFQDLAPRTWANEARARRIGRGAHTHDHAASAGVGVDHPRTGARATLLVEHFQPLAVVQLTQCFGGDALDAPEVSLTAVTERGVLEGDRKPLRARFVLARFGLERGAQWRREASPAPTSQPRKVLLERLDTRVGFEDFRVI